MRVPLYIAAPSQHCHRVIRTLSVAVMLMVAACGASYSAEEILYEQKLEPYPFFITVPVVVRGQAYTFYLDTGTAINSFDLTLKNLLNTYRETQVGRTFEGNPIMSIFDAPPIALALWTIPPSPAFLFDWKPFSIPSGVTALGLIGASSLKQCALSLDFDHRTLKISKETLSSSSGMESLPLQSQYPGITLPGKEPAMKLADDYDSVPIVKLPLGDEVIEFTIDTGYDDCIGLNHDTFTRFLADGTIELDKQPFEIYGNWGPNNITKPWGRFTKGQLLGVDLKGIPVDDATNVNTIGMAFLLNFNVVIDFKNGAFLYQRRKAAPPVRFTKMLGAHLTFLKGQDHIYLLDPEGGAAKDAGLQIWDRITRLGPLNEADINCISLYELCLHHAGESLEVEVVRPGATQPIVTRLKLPTMQFIYPQRE